MEQNESINGKRILFLAPAFFGYELKIKLKMEEMGAVVDFHDVRSVKKAYEKAILKISPNVFSRKTKAYYMSIIEANKTKNYDFVFVVKCDMISADILTQLRTLYKNAKFCLYLWDSINNIPGVSKKLHLFDRVLSFDRKDTKKYPGIVFRPLFYIDDFKRGEVADPVAEHSYELSFCGTIHSDRYKIIKRIKKLCADKNYRFYTFAFLQSKFIYYFYKLYKPEFWACDINEFSFSKLSSEEISKIADGSLAVLDIQHPKQSGLTMRTIEMIGMNKKLITTNQDIASYDFYNPANVLIISRQSDTIKIPDDFLSTKYIPLELSLYEKYSITNWILEILIG